MEHTGTPGSELEMTMPQVTADAVVGFLYNATPMTVPSDWWVALHYGGPGTSGMENEWTEAGRRQCVVWTATDGQEVNGEELVWEELPQVLTGCEEIGYCTIWTAEEGGTCLQVCEGTAKTVNTGGRFLVEVGGLVVRWG